MIISLIACMDDNNAIGYQNKLLFKNKDDIEWFKQHTINKVCIMGRKTYESIGKPLKHRVNVVLTFDKNYNPHKDVLVYHSIDQILKDFQHEKEIMVIGGSNVYTQFLPLADRLYLTKVHTKYEKADAFFPKYSECDWAERYFREGKNSIYPYTFHVYHKVNK